MLPYLTVITTRLLLACQFYKNGDLIRLTNSPSTVHLVCWVPEPVLSQGETDSEIRHFVPRENENIHYNVKLTGTFPKICILADPFQ